ncbi:unnamed protein product [Urochloa humidicola]
MIAAVAVLVAAAAALPLQAAGAYADCYDYCFKDCISKDKSMRDYCSYACDKTCSPDAAAVVTTRRLPAASAGLAFACQVDCVRKSCSGVRADGKDMEDCYGQCYDGCETKAGMPRPLRAGAGAFRPAALPDHPFHGKHQDAVGPTALPDHPEHGKQDDGAVQPTAEPDPDHVSHQASGNVVLP